MITAHCIPSALTVHRTNRKVRVCPFLSATNGWRKHKTIYIFLKDKGKLIRPSAGFVPLSHEHGEMMGGGADSEVVKQIPGIASSLSDSFCVCCPKHGGLCVKQTKGKQNGSMEKQNGKLLFFFF